MRNFAFPVFTKLNFIHVETRAYTFFIAAYCDIESTPWPIESSKKAVDFPVPGGNRQNPLRPPDASPYTPSRKKPKPRLDRIDKNLNDPTRSRHQLPYGVIIHAPTTVPRVHQAPPPIRSQPDGPQTRRLGNQNSRVLPVVVPMPGTSHGDIFEDRRGGERHDMETWGYDRYRPGQANKDTRTFVPHPQEKNVFEDENDLIKDTHDGAHCAAKCEEMEFFCVQSCSCLHKNLRCDGNIDCQPYGEDEKDCEELRVGNVFWSFITEKKVIDN